MRIKKNRVSAGGLFGVARPLPFNANLNNRMQIRLITLLLLDLLFLLHKLIIVIFFCCCSKCCFFCTHCIYKFFFKRMSCFRKCTSPKTKPRHTQNVRVSPLLYFVPANAKFHTNADFNANRKYIKYSDLALTLCCILRIFFSHFLFVYLFFIFFSLFCTGKYMYLAGSIFLMCTQSMSLYLYVLHM